MNAAGLLVTKPQQIAHTHTHTHRLFSIFDTRHIYIYIHNAHTRTYNEQVKKISDGEVKEEFGGEEQKNPKVISRIYGVDKIRIVCWILPPHLPLPPADKNVDFHSLFRARCENIRSAKIVIIIGHPCTFWFCPKYT